MLKDWKKMPENMQTEEVRPYYEALKKKKCSLFLKRCFDLVLSVLMLLFLLPLLAILALLVVCDSKGGVFYRQERVTQYGRTFRIFKFRTMVANADRMGAQVTVQGDARITRIGGFLRKYRLDELPQLLNIVLGDMSFVGTRPESVYYVKAYTPEMMATLLLPAGVTSEASIRYKDEAKLLDRVDNVDEVYIHTILPQKMKYNLESIRNFGLGRDIATMFRTVGAVFKE